MKAKKLTGIKVPRFTYDTPKKAENDFYDLCVGDKPLVIVFLSNFGHPISRAYLKAYMQTIGALTSGRLACVVRSKPQRIAEYLGDADIPFTVICDADGVLYEYLEVRETTSIFDWTLAARRIIKEAQQEGYEHVKGAPQLLPLTIVFGAEGEVLFAHRARSLTDLPENCIAIENFCQHLVARLPEDELPPLPKIDVVRAKMYADAAVDAPEQATEQENEALEMPQEEIAEQDTNAAEEPAQPLAESQESPEEVVEVVTEESEDDKN